MSWSPDMPVFGRARLTSAESRWLEQDADVPASRVRRPHRFAERMLLAASQCATAVRNATVAVPPPNRREMGSRGIVGPSDPALAQVEATHHAIERACVRLGHIVDDCLLCDGYSDVPLSCNTSSEVTLARLVGQDFTELADHLVGLSATSPKALTIVTGRFDATFARAAVACVDVWDGMHRGGAEPHDLRDYVGQIVEVTARLNSVKGLLGQWLPGTQVRLCKNGCGRPAPELRPGAFERGGGAQCRRCLESRTA